MTATYYVQLADLTAAIGLPAVLQLLDDNNTYGAGPGDATFAANLLSIQKRATSWCDSWISDNYNGPFPITQSPPPALLAEAALYKALEFSYMRRTEFVRAVDGERSIVQTYERMAAKLLQNIVDAVQQMPDNAAQTKPANVGAIIYDNAPRMAVDSIDGTANGDGY